MIIGISLSKLTQKKTGIGCNKYILNSHPFHRYWHAVAYCSAAPRRRPPSGKIEKNGGMQGEEHLVFLVLVVAGNVEDGEFITS